MTNQATAGTPTCDCKLWDILVESAKERTTIRYSKLARQAGLEQCQDELRTLLQRIRMYCTENHLPILSAIVMDDVSKIRRPLLQPAGCPLGAGTGLRSRVDHPALSAAPESGTCPDQQGAFWFWPPPFLPRPQRPHPARCASL